MKFELLNLRQGIILFLSLFTLIGYEYHIYYLIGVKFNQLILLGVFFLILFLKDFKINKVDKIPIIIYSTLFLLSIFSLLLRLSTGITNSFFELIKNSFLLINLLSILTIFSKEDTRDFLKYSFYLIVIISIINLPIIFFGRFLIWQKQNLRLASIFLDPNYYGVLTGFSILYAILIWRVSNKILYYGVLSLLFLSIFMTFSKGAILALIISLIYISFKKSPIAAFLLTTFLSLVSLFFINRVIEKLKVVKLLRIEMGLNRRGMYWNMALDKLKQNPISGYGTENVKSEILALGYENSSFHNYYIEQAYINGIFFIIGIVILILISIFKLNKEDYRVCSFLIYLAISANNFSYSIGGVGFLSILFTFLIAYVYQHSYQYPQIIYKDENNQG